jgi:REP element-mobilizing transposase RayT
MSKAPRQMALDLRTHGGKRTGAGRKPNGPHALVSHSARPRFGRITPVHVTLKVRRDVPNLRTSRRFELLRKCFRASRGLHGLRLVEFSVLGEHLHLVVEAESSVCLSRGMQGLCVRIARRLNRLLSRVGKLFADHFHSRLLPTPTEVARAINYVRNNARHHYGEGGVDPFSSAARGATDVLAEPFGWLLRIGWRRLHPRELCLGSFSLCEPEPEG